MSEQRYNPTSAEIFRKTIRVISSTKNKRQLAVCSNYVGAAMVKLGFRDGEFPKAALSQIRGVFYCKKAELEREE